MYAIHVNDPMIWSKKCVGTGVPRLSRRHRSDRSPNDTTALPLAGTPLSSQHTVPHPARQQYNPKPAPCHPHQLPIRGRGGDANQCRGSPSQQWDGPPTDPPSVKIFCPFLKAQCDGLPNSAPGAGPMEWSLRCAAWATSPPVHAAPRSRACAHTPSDAAASRCQRLADHLLSERAREP